MPPQRVAAQQAAGTGFEPAPQTACAQGFHHIVRAAGDVPTTGSQVGRDGALVKPQDNNKDGRQAERRLRPLCRRRLRTPRPPAVDMRARKPIFFLRRRLFG
jgi:hypothetical protein